MKKEKRVIKFHKQIQINIGLIIFGIIFIYVLFHVFSFITSDNITVYEVTEGTISKDTTYQALAIRQEENVQATTAGNIFYYAPNLDQVGVKTNIYSVESSGNITDKLRGSNHNLDVISKSDLSKLTNSIREFTFDYSDDDFQKVYHFRTDLASDLQQYYSSNMMQELESEIAQAQQQGKFSFFQPPCVGVVVYQTDGLEGVSLASFDKDTFDAKKLSVTNLKNQEKVKEGQVVYKLITSDKWNLVMEIDKSLAKTLQSENTEYIQIRFLEDNATTWTSCKVEKRDHAYYLILSLDDSVERYALSRFVHIALLLDEQSGLKIPNTAIVEKEFFEIPKNYFFKGNDSDESGLMVKKGSSSELVIPTIYYETDSTYYIDSEKVSADDVIIKPDASDTYRIGSKTAKLKGVYNINKGYAIFKQIEILYQNEDYAIVNKGTSYGIANYDHIALQGDSIKENDLINQ